MLIFLADGTSPGTSQSARTGAVQVNPRDPSELFVGFEGDGVYTSSDAGATWVSANTCLANTIIEGITMDLGSPGTLYVSTFASVSKTRGKHTNHGSCDRHLRYESR